jgi:hypothetical protein
MNHREHTPVRPVARLSAVAVAVALGGMLLSGYAIAGESGSGSMSQGQKGAMAQTGSDGESHQAGSMAGTESDQAAGGDKPITKRLPDRYKLST